MAPRSVSRYAGAATAVLVLAGSVCACASQSTGSGGGSAGQTLTVAIQNDLRETSQLQLSDPDSFTIMGGTVWEPLWTADPHGNSTPVLATGATSSPDFLTWTFTIRSGVKFSNGNPFTAEDVKLNLDAFTNPKNASPLDVYLTNIKSYTVLSPTKIQFKLKAPDANLPSLFTDTMYMADMKHYNANHPIGTGPYMWSGRVPGSSITFVRNPLYWRGRPPLAKVVFQVIPDPQVAALDLERGDVDVVTNYLNPKSVPGLRSNPDLTVHSIPGGQDYVVLTDFEKARRGGYKNALDVREGLAYLWNAQKLIPPIIGAFGTIAWQPLPPSYPGTDPTIKGPAFPYNPAKGKQLLAAGGIGPGGTIRILVREAPYNCDVATAFASELKTLGYNPQLQCIEPEVADAATQKYNWDLLMTRHTPFTDAAHSYQDAWSVADVPNPPTDVETLRDSQLQAILDKMTATSPKLDSATYAQLGSEAAQTIVKQQVAYLPGYFANVTYVSRSNIKGIVLVPTSYNCWLMNGFTTVTKS